MVEYTRVLVACIVFAVVEPRIAEWFGSWPGAVTGVLAAGTGALVAWASFQFVFARTVLTVRWTDVVENREVPDSYVRMAETGSPSRRYSVEVERNCPTSFAHFLFRQLAKRNYRLAIDPSQKEVELVVEKGSAEIDADAEMILFPFAKADHPRNSQRVDVHILWSGNGGGAHGDATDFRYSAHMESEFARLIAKLATRVDANVKGAYVARTNA